MIIYINPHSEGVIGKACNRKGKREGPECKIDIVILNKQTKGQHHNQYLEAAGEYLSKKCVGKFTLK